MKKSIAISLTLALLVSVNVSVKATTIIPKLTAQNMNNISISNPVYNAKTDIATWDCIYFGHYWQTDTNGDGMADEKDEKKPIKWRVLSVNENDAFLMADSNLDIMSYDKLSTSITWQKCTLRSWLNGYDKKENTAGVDYSKNNFLDTAFISEEQALIKNTTVLNEKNPKYGTKGGSNTQDKVYLLSITEVSNVSYGFNKNADMSTESVTRLSANSAYLVAKGYSDGYGAGKSDWWWLRSPGTSSLGASYVGPSGIVRLSGDASMYGVHGVRPVLHIDISDKTYWTYAGKVSSTASKRDSGNLVKDISSNAYYQIVSKDTEAGKMSYVRPANKRKKVKIPAVVYYNGRKYKVTTVAPKAFAGNKKLKTLIIGKNVKTIQKKAFANCKKLSKVTVKSKVLKKVGKNAFRGTKGKVTVKVPKKQRAKYKKLFKGKGNKKLQVK